MINLLPTDYKQDLVYAKRNSKLLKWTGAVLASVVLVCAVIIGGLFYIDQSTKSYESRVALAQQQLKDQQMEETQARLKGISENFKLVLQVLSKQILFSELIKQVGAAMPAGSSLSSLSINKVQGGIDLNAVALDYQTATQVQLNLQDPENKLFEKADIVNITCNSDSTGPASQYPCTVTIRALFSKNNPFLFTAQPEAKTP